LRYKLETSRTLYTPAKGTDSLEQTLANTKGECRGTFSLAQASQRKGIGSHIQKHEQPSCRAIEKSKSLREHAPTKANKK
jgi:hypothetical protein